VGVCERDPFQIGGRATEPANLAQDKAAVGLVERIDERQLAPVLDEEGADVAAALTTDRVDAWSEFHVLSVAG
jgi:hypothetical protein